MRGGVHSPAEPPVGSWMRRSREVRWQSTQQLEKSSISSELEKQGRRQGQPGALGAQRGGRAQGKQQSPKEHSPPTGSLCW